MRDPQWGQDTVGARQFVGAIDIDGLLSGEMPCALVDASAKILRASPGLFRLQPTLDGRDLVEAFSLDAALYPPSPGQVTFGTYIDALGEAVPVAVQHFPVAGEHAAGLAVFFDCIDFRQADFSRLTTSPYPALRMSLRGTITAATKDMTALFCTPAHPSLIGVAFLTLFEDTDRIRIEAALNNCVNGTGTDPINVLALTRDGGERVELALLPDCGPDQRVLGTIALIRSRKMEESRERLKKIAMETGRWQSRIAAVVDELRNFIAFDFVTFGIYAKDVSAFRSIYIEPTTMTWPAVWVKISPGVRSWLEDGHTYEKDLAKFVKEHPETANDPVTRQYLKAEARAFVTLPVFGPTGPVCSLSLVSRQSCVYDQRTLTLLKTLAVDQVLTAIHYDLSTELKAVTHDIDRLVRSADSLKVAAESLVTKLYNFFSCNHVSIVTIDFRLKRFKLLAQSCDEGCDIRVDFEQGVEEGMFGCTLLENKGRTEEDRKCLMVSDPTSGKQQYDYRPTNPEMKSALTCPIRFNGEWRWILNIETIELNGFHETDGNAVVEIIRGLESSLHRLYQAELNRIILDSTREGIIIVDHVGNILDANQTASERLLGTRKNFGKIETYAGDDTTEKILRGELADASRRLVFDATPRPPIGGNAALDDRAARPVTFRRPALSSLRTVLGLRSDLADELQASVWFLTDLDTLDWNVDFRYLRTIANDVAQQTRPSLMLASTILQKMVREFRGSDVASRIKAFAEQAVAQIAKADITFERLAELQSIAKSPTRQAKPFDVGTLIEEVRASFPDYDRKCIDCRSEVHAVVEGDRVSIGFVFRSLIDYLLRCIVDDEGETSSVQVRIRPSHRAGCKILLKLSNLTRLKTAYDKPNDWLWQAVDTAHVDASVGLPAIESIIKAHDGVFEKYQGDHDPMTLGTLWATFVVTLPLANKPGEN